ncbi:MAG: Ig-like domain-containing protein [Planctomycetaceae bacterium]
MYSVSATAGDLAGNSVTDVTSNEVEVDITDPDAPTVNFLTTNDQTPTLTGTWDETTATILTVEVNGNTFTLDLNDPLGSSPQLSTDGSGNWTLNLDGTPILPEAIYAVTATNTDLAGNDATDPSINELTIDITRPAPPTITTPIEGDNLINAVEDDDVLVTGTAEPLSTLTLTIDDGNNPPVVVTVTTDGAGNWTLLGSEVDLSSLDDGPLSMIATATDAAGNVSLPSNEALPVHDTATAPITIDGPVEGDDVVNLIESPDVLITGTAEPGSTVTVTLDDGNPLTPPVTATVTTAPDGTWTLSGNEVDISGLDDGPITITAVTVDAAGNPPESATTSVTKDTTAPNNLGIDDPTEGDDFSNIVETPDVTITGTGAEPTSTVVVTLEDQNGNILGPINATVNPDGTWSIPDQDLTGLDDGPITVTATETDLAGNEGTPVTESFIKDTTPPTGLGIDDPTEMDDISNAVESTDVTITGTGAEPMSTVVVTLEDQNGNILGPINVTVNPDGTWSIPDQDITGLVDGPITITATETDEAGNEGTPVTESFIKDTTPPTGLGIDDPTESDDVSNATESADVTITGTGAEPASTVVVTLEDQNGNTLGPITATVNPDGTWSIPDQDITGLDDGPITITATETDEAGNEGTPVTELFTKDTTPPSIDPQDSDALTITSPIAGADNTANDAEDNQVLIEGTAEALSVIDIEIEDGSGNIVTAQVMTDGSGNWSLLGQEVDLSGLDQGTLTVSATATDTSGNTSPPVTTTFDHDSIISVTITGPIEGDDSLSDAEDDDVLVVGTTDPHATVDVTFSDGNGNILTITVTADGSGNWTLLGNEADLSGFDQGTITVTAFAEDPFGNTATTSTSVVHDSVHPAMPTVNTLITNDQTPTLTGTWDEVGANLLEVTVNGVTYTLDQNHPLNSDPQLTTDGSGNWTLNLNGTPLLAEGVYEVSVTNSDDVGNDSSDITTAELEVDITNPATPTANNLITNQVKPTINGTWDEATASLLTVQVNGVVYTLDLNNPLGSSPELSSDGNGNWTLDFSVGPVALPPGGYNVIVTNRDDAGNSRGDVTVGELVIDVTDPLAATDPPNLTDPTDTGLDNADDLTFNTTPTFDGDGGEPGSTATIYAQPTDANGVPTGPPIAIGTATVNPDGTYEVPTNPGNPLPEGFYAMTVTFTDVAGNESDPSPRLLIEVDTTAPTGLLIDDPTEGDDFVNIVETPVTTITGTGVEPTSTVAVTLEDQNGNTLGPIQAVVHPDGTWTLPDQDITSLADGPISITAVETDAAGNVGPTATEEFEKDTIAPTGLAINGPVEGDDIANIVETPDVSITGTGAEPTSTVAVTLTDDDGNTVGPIAATVNPDGTWSIPDQDLTSLIDGPITVTAIETDEAGNPGNPVVANFVKDTTAPNQLAIDSPVEGDDFANIVETPDVTITGTGAEPTSIVVVTLEDQNGNILGPINATVNPDGTWSIPDQDITGLDDGPITITATETDEAGNEGAPVTGSFVKDATPPTGLVIDGDGPQTIEGDQVINAAEALDVTITGTGVEPTSTVEVTITDGEGNTVGPIAATVNPDGTWSIPDQDFTGLVDGPLTVSAVETDNAGNVADPVESILTKDTVPPNPPPVDEPLDMTDETDSGEDNQDNLTSNTTPTFTGTGGEPGGTATLYITPTDDEGNPTGPPVSSGTVIVNPDGSYTITPNDELPDGNYIANVTFTDLAGNESTFGPDLPFEIDTIPPVTPEAPDLVDASDSGDSAHDDITNDNTPTFTGTGAPGDTVTLFMQPVDENGNPTGPSVVVGTAIVDPDGTYTATSTTVLSDGNYLTTVQFTDPDGNESLISPPLAITIDTLSPDMPDVTETLPRTLSGTGEPGSTVTITDVQGNPMIDPQGNPVQAVVAPNGTWVIANIGHNIPSGSSVQVHVTDAAGNTTSMMQRVDYFGFDSLNNLNPLTFQGPHAIFSRSGGNTEPLISAQMVSFNANPIISGSATPGTLLAARIYDVDGSLIDEVFVTADQAGNWVAQFTGQSQSQSPRIVIEHIGSAAVPLGQAALTLSARTYSQLQFATIGSSDLSIEGILNGTAGNALQQNHQSNLNPLRFL